MKKVLLGETYSCNVYFVPDEVAKNLEKYCLEYCEWLRGTSPEAEKLRKKRRPCPCEEEFVKVYLNKIKFPQYESKFVEELSGKCSFAQTNPNLPVEYRNNPEYNGLPYFYF